MATVFTKIINGDIPSYKVAENDDFYAFLDINPNAEGHTLVIPKQETDKLFDLPKATYLDLMDFAYQIAKALEKTVDCERIGMSVIGLEVPHVHVHLIPINSMKDMQFTKKETLSEAAFTTLVNQIAENFKSISSNTSEG